MRHVTKRSVPSGCRHSAGDTVPECPAASAAARPERRSQRSGMGHCGDSGAPRHVAGEPRGRDQVAEVA